MALCLLSPLCVTSGDPKALSGPLAECLLTPPVDTTFVQQFLSVELAEEAAPVVRQDVLKHFLGMFGSPSYTDDVKAAALRLIITPMLRASMSPVRSRVPCLGA